MLTHELIGCAVVGAVVPTRNHMTALGRTRSVNFASAVVDVEMRLAEMEAVKFVAPPTRAWRAIGGSGNTVTEILVHSQDP